MIESLAASVLCAVVTVVCVILFIAAIVGPNEDW